MHGFHSTKGAGVYDVNKVPPCNLSTPCHNSPWWDLENAAHGREYELNRYESDGSTLLEQVKTRWEAVCPPPGG